MLFKSANWNNFGAGIRGIVLSVGVIAFSAAAAAASTTAAGDYVHSWIATDVHIYCQAKTGTVVTARQG